MSKIAARHLYKWVESFMLKHGLYPKSRSCVVAFSGGEDSVLLYNVLLELKKQPNSRLREVRAIHIDHGLRPESAEQAEQLQEFYPELEIVKIEEVAPSCDVELWARRHRHALLKSFLKKGDVLYMGHHIDDSIEWYMRQTFGGSSELCFGIPLVNGSIMRPFHCLSKKHISYFINELDLFYVEDSSNFDTRFQRNFLRHKVLAPLYKEFPKAQAHFVEKANQWALELHSSKDNYKQGLRSIEKESIGLKVLLKTDNVQAWSQYRSQIKRAIHDSSSKQRGEIRQTLDLLIASLGSKRGGQGPFSFSGGVKVYCYAQMIIVLDSKKREALELWDREVAKKLLIGSEIPMVVSFKRKTIPKNIELNLPFIFYRQEEFSFMGKKASRGHVNNYIFPQITEVMRKRGCTFRPISFLWKAIEKKGDREIEAEFIAMA